MAQIEDPANLDLLPDHTTRALVVVIIETGLRANDACALAFNPIVNDSSGWLAPPRWLPSDSNRQA